MALENREVLTDEEAIKILKYYNFPVVKTAVATNADEAVALAHEIGYPVVLKILSPQIVQKRAAGGVILNVNSPNEVREAFEILIQRAATYNPNAKIIGVTVQPMIEKKGYEIIIGGKTDPVFGPVILFGMGGVGCGTLQGLLHRASTVKYNTYTPHDGGNQGLPAFERIQ